MNTMHAAVVHGIDDVRIEQVPRPTAKAGEAVIRITATTICGTDPLDALELFAAQGDGVMKVALFPHGVPRHADVTLDAVAAAW